MISGNGLKVICPRIIMKKFVNNVDAILTESLTGFGDAHSDIINVNLKPDKYKRDK